MPLHPPLVIPTDRRERRNLLLFRVHIHGIRRIPVSGDTRNRGLVHKQGYLITDNQENQGDGARYKASVKAAAFLLPLFHSASVYWV